MRFGDVVVGLEAPDPDRLRRLQRTVAQMAPADDEPAALLRIVERTPAVPDRAPDFTEHSTSFWVDGDELVVAFAGAVARASDAGAALGGAGAQDGRVLRRLLLPAMTHLLAARDRFALHAAAVCSPGERAAVVCAGASGRGKSTVAFAAWRAGWTVLADDMAIVRAGRGGLEVAGVPQEFAVPAELVPAGDRDALGLRPYDDDVRQRLLVHVDAPETSWRPLGAFARVAHGDTADGQLVAVDGADAMPAVLSAFTSVLAPDRLRAFLPVAGSLARLPTWELRLARDPARRVADVQRNLASVV